MKYTGPEKTLMKEYGYTPGQIAGLRTMQRSTWPSTKKARKTKRRKVTRVKRNPHRTVPPIKKQRALTNDDLWSAVRGLGMFRKSIDELITLYNEHKGKEAFASKVIAEAAKQVAVTKGAKVKRK